MLPSGVTAANMRIAYKAPPPTPGAERPTEWCAVLRNCSGQGGGMGAGSSSGLLPV